MAADDHPPTPVTPVDIDANAQRNSEQQNSSEGHSFASRSRTELVNRARSFLNSPQVRDDTIAAKRSFLVEKGLTPAEVDLLIGEIPLHAPPIPPRTYPPPPASNLPYVLLGIFRIFSWIAGGSAAVLLLYYRFILPRLAHSYHARHSLRTHQASLMEKLNNSIQSLREVQTETFSLLPAPERFLEATPFKDCTTLDELFSTESSKGTIPDVSLLRCAIQDVIAAQEGVKGASTDQIFALLESKDASFGGEKGAGKMSSLWETLNTCPAFHLSREDPNIALWSYDAPPPSSPSPPPPLLSSLEHLNQSLVNPTPERPHQHVLQSLIDLTGYLTAQAYSLGNYRTSIGFGSSTTLDPQQEDIRREIRALKGLVLNRRSFLPSIPRPNSVPIPPAARQL
ncbi:hypothetical protein PUNSTDRAFT_142529 [Punctularia strigosozonata HHB-11173 SS5]|uniref:uncharacterized protein n=1 Tax=Punctularia strigosozonata (strain HHB-11173) TaxID=741275 RepID=UPI0004418054|nr:uncharacterized protein PUNSTDRAFT_142529 [Punctularia strigosozonata HHB-11173 SS5]EIN10534.1 hypothetical protein PUNSTDRAFT_142529 [Punctularia strigosozonata HHB-11173 SS5]